MLQVLDNGRLTDTKNRVVNFKNTIIILTSNIGAQFIDKMEKIGFASGAGDKAKYEDVKDKVMQSLKDYFRPEFLNRLDSILLFDVLSIEAIKEIVKIQIEQVIKRLAEKEIRLEIQPTVLEYLAKEGYNPQYGARPLRRLIQEKILTPIAGFMISQEVNKGGAISVGQKNSEFTFDIKKGRKPVLVKMFGDEIELVKAEKSEKVAS